MTWKVVLPVAAAIGLSVSLGACDGLQRELGLTKQSPDEFRVVSRAPLTLPPDFALRPPAPGTPRPQEGTATQQARKAIFRADEPKTVSLDTAMPADGRSVGERSLLLAAGVDKVDPNIRTVVERETLQLNEESESFIDGLIFWRTAEAPGEIVDAAAEAQRLRENTALGKETSGAETPTIERRRKAIFEGVF